MGMKAAMFLIAGLLIGFWAGWYFKQLTNYRSQISNKPVVVERPFLKYTIENLGKREYRSQIFMDEIAASNAAFFVQKFHFDSDGKNVTGLAHIPDNCVKCPVILQFRGYADPQVYYPGYGTEHTAQEFAKAGFVSLAPDFLSFGGSASASADVFEARFETYTTALNLIAAASSWDGSNGKIAIWGHSNGGQIALTVAEIDRKNYPTAVWAPVTAGFPYSILFYMNDNQEGDKNLRKKLADFESVYDANLFSLIDYSDRISAPIEIDQGTADDSVPVKWSDDFTKLLKKNNKDITYRVYPGADHNLAGAWSQAVKNDIDFFGKKLGLTE